MARNKINKDVEVVIANNTGGSYFYQSQNGQLIIDLENRGDEDYVTFADIKSIMSRHRKTIEDLDLLIVDVLDDEVTIDDVVEALRVTDSYNELKSISLDGEINVDTIYDFVTKGDPERVKKIAQSEKSKLIHRVAEATIRAFRKDELKDLNKLSSISNGIGHIDPYDYWKDSTIE